MQAKVEQFGQNRESVRFLYFFFFGSGKEKSLYLLIINMLAGRVGLFAFLIALAGTPTPRHYRYPSVKIPLT